MATGTLLKNGSAIGQIEFNTPPVEGTSSGNQPHPVVKLTAGGSIDF